MNRLFYDTLGGPSGAGGGGEKEREIPQSYKNWATAYADTIADDSPKSFRDHLGAELYNAMCVAYRHLSPSPFPPIPRDIVSFWDEVLKKPIPCPDESRYFEWCYWMLKNERPVHQIQLENEVDKVVYTVGDIVKELYQDTMVEHTVKSLHWHGNYWFYTNETGGTAWIDGPIKGDIYHRDRFQRKSEESPLPYPSLRWVKASERLPPVHSEPVIVRNIRHGKVEKMHNWGHNRGHNRGWDTGMDRDFHWDNTEWLDESPSLPGEQDKNLMAKAIRMRDAYNSYIHTLAEELFVFGGGKDRGIDHFKEQQDARNTLTEALKPFIGTDLQPPPSHEASVPGKQIIDPISLYKASIGVSEQSAEKGEQDGMRPLTNFEAEILQGTLKRTAKTESSRESAGLGEQVEGKGEGLSDFCQMLIDARQDKGLSIAEAEDGAHIAHGYLAHLEAGKYNRPSTHALYCLAKLYEIELKPLLVAGGVIVKRDQESPHPSVEADQQVPRQAMVDALGNIPVAEAFKIAKCIDAEMESLIRSVENWEWKYHQAEKEIATLKESFKSSIYQHDQDMEIVKGERDWYRQALKEEASYLSDCVAKTRIGIALNKFTNKE